MWRYHDGRGHLRKIEDEDFLRRERAAGPGQRQRAAGTMKPRREERGDYFARRADRDEGHEVEVHWRRRPQTFD